MKSTAITKLRAITSKLHGPRHKDGEEWIQLEGIQAFRSGKLIKIAQIGKGNTLICEENRAYDTFEFVNEEDLCANILAQLKAKGY